MQGRQNAAVIAAALIVAGNASAADWTLETGRDPATYRDVATLHQEAAAAIDDEYATAKVRPRLEFRCEPGAGDAMQVRIDWRRFVSSFNTPVTFAVDDAEPLTVTLGVDRANRITATKDGDDDRRLREYLQGHATLTVTVTPYSEVPVHVQYDLENLDDGLRQLAEACTARETLHKS